MTQAFCLTSGTSSGVASFFASLSCVVCPFFEAVTGVRLGARAWVAAFLAITGAGVLEMGNGAIPTAGDLTGLLQPVLFGLYLIRTEAAMKKFPSEAMEITVLQTVVVSIVALAWGAIGASGGSWPDAAELIAQTEAVFSNIASHPIPSLGLLWMGAFPSAMALALETVIVSKLSSSVSLCRCDLVLSTGSLSGRLLSLSCIRGMLRSLSPDLSAAGDCSNVLDGACVRCCFWFNVPSGTFWPCNCHRGGSRNFCLCCADRRS